MAGESLKVVAGNAAGSSIALEQELVIGRSTPGLGSLGGDSEISRVHARIYHDASGQLIVEDLGSTNGTFVNGTRIGGAQQLRAGDQVRVGQTTMSVEGGAAEGATTVGQIVPPPAAAVPPPAAAVAATPPTQPFQPAQPPQGPPPGAPQPGYAGGPIGGPPGAQSTGGGGSKAPWIALAAVVLIALIVGGLAIGGVFSSDKKSSTTAIAPVATTPAPAATTPAPPPPTAAMPAPPPTPSTPSTGGGGYPPGFISKLIASCSKGGKLTPSQCSCWFTKLKNAYTFPQLIAVIRKAQGGSIPPKAVGLLRTCLSQ
jgi:pSer/pThr/pTyr-binding forkhead associated (FHA) protein